MDNSSFYAECAALLGTTHENLPFTHYKRTRWNNRTPGSGRFAGFGIIRVFGNTVHIALTAPKPVHLICKSKDEALEFLRSLNS